MRIINYLVNQIILVTCGSKPFSDDLAHSRRPETHNTATMKRRLSILFLLMAATVITALAHTSHVLGNVRNVVREDDAVVESNEYYPYGGLFSATPSVQPYKYGAKELDRTHGLDWYDSQARWVNPMSGRTTTMDRFAEKYYHLSPYLWCAANPVKFVDPDGNIPLETIWDAANVSLGIKSLFSNIKEGKIGSAVIDGLGVVVDAAATIIPYVPGGVSTGIKTYRLGTTSVKAAKEEVRTFTTSRAARREVMRNQNIPTSMQPKSQSKNASGREYTYEAPKEGGVKHLKSVQQQTKDRCHEEQPHLEAGRVKVQNGQVRYNNYNRPKLENTKSKAYYDEK